MSLPFCRLINSKPTQVFPMHARDDRYAKFFLFERKLDSYAVHTMTTKCVITNVEIVLDPLLNALVSSSPLTCSNHDTNLRKQKASLGLWPYSIPSPLSAH